MSDEIDGVRPDEPSPDEPTWDEGSDQRPQRARLRGDETELFRAFHSRLVRAVQRLVNTSPDIVDDACAFAWVEFGRWQPREVPHAFQVSHAHRALLEHDRPVVALATKAVHGSRFVELVVALGLRFRLGSQRSFDAVEKRTSRLVLQRGLVCAAAHAQSLGET